MLHNFRIVHVDIKPENIMFSLTLEELVFIDFGFSRVLREKAGQMSRTMFIGSMKYCCS